MASPTSAPARAATPLPSRPPARNDRRSAPSGLRSSGLRGPALAAVVLAALGAGYLCTLSALDRSLVGQSALPMLGATRFGTMGLRGKMTAAIHTGKMATAEAVLSTMVAREPYRQSDLALLGTLRVQHGADAAARAFESAALLGWRDPTTGLFWLAQGRANDDMEMVAQRVDGLLRIGYKPPVDYIAQLEASRAGRAALAARLAHDPPWMFAYLSQQWPTTLSPQVIANRAATLRQARAEGMIVDCIGINWVAQDLVNKHFAPDAANLWFPLCAGQRDVAAGVLDGSFDRVPESDSGGPFDWKLRTSGGLDAHVETAQPPLRGNALYIRSTGPTSETAAQQIVFLRPGSYRVGWSVGTGAADLARIQVNCPGGDVLDRTANVTARDAHRAYDLTIPAGCPYQEVRIVIDPQPIGGAAIAMIDDVRIAPR